VMRKQNDSVCTTSKRRLKQSARFGKVVSFAVK